jgi:hypothetical protein
MNKLFEESERITEVGIKKEKVTLLNKINFHDKIMMILYIITAIKQRHNISQSI